MNKSNNRSIKEEDSGEAKDIRNGRKKEREQTEEVKLISRGNQSIAVVPVAIFLPL